MINPTINDNPFRYVKVLFLSSDAPPIVVCGFVEDIGAPMGAYPLPVDEDKGKRFEEKSKTDETEKDRA